MGKYRNKKVTVDGISFDSMVEADYYCTLKELKNVGVVKEFICQPKFKISEPYTRNKKKVAAAYYVLDFQVFYADGRVEYIDVKGFATEVSKLKRKLLESQNPGIRVKWIERNFAYGDEYGWIEKDELKEIIKNNKRKSIEQIKNK